MNNSRWPDHYGMYGYDSANGSSIPLETYVNRDAGYPVSETTVRRGISNHPSPNSPMIIENDSLKFDGTAKHHGYVYTFSSWFPEFVCCILGILAMMADIIILAIADGQPPTDVTSFLVTTNSLIQFITSVAKVAFLVPNVSALGQLRWLWFKDGARPLRDFLLHHDAGLGGLSSLKFSLNFRILFKSPIAWLASVVALSSFFTSPLTQLTIGYVTDLQVLNNGTASVLRASSFSRSDASGFKQVHGDDLLVQRAYLTAAYLGPNQTLPGVDPICSSGDCDWPIYGSLGVCTETVNLSASTNSSLLFWLQEVFLAELRESRYSTVFAAAGSDPYYLAVLIPFPSPSTEFKESPQQAVISQYFVGYFNSPVSLTNDTDLARMQYIGVSLYFCTQSFSTTVKGGIHNTSELAYSSNIVSSTTTESINSYWNSAIYGKPICDPGPLTGSTITLSGPTGLSNETYTIDFCSGVYLSELYIIGAGGGIVLDPQLLIVVTVGQISQALGIALYGDFNSSSPVPDPSTRYNNIDFMMNNIGKSLTSFMRNEGPTFPNQDNSTVTGIAYAPQTLIHVRWLFLSLLAIQLALTIIVLFFTIVITYRSRMQILKESLLAAMVALSATIKTELGGMEDMEELERRARKLKVELKSSANGDIRGFSLV